MCSFFRMVLVKKIGLVKNQGYNNWWNWIFDSSYFVHLSLYHHIFLIFFTKSSSQIYLWFFWSCCMNNSFQVHCQAEYILNCFSKWQWMIIHYTYSLVSYSWLMENSILHEATTRVAIRMLQTLSRTHWIDYWTVLFRTLNLCTVWSMRNCLN